MTTAEAANHLGLTHYEDLFDAVEMNVFQCKQELIQKADQILLFPSKEKRLQLLQTAAETLGFTFENEAIPTLPLALSSNNIEAHFHQFQANRSLLLSAVGNVESFRGLIDIQGQLMVNYQHWTGFWKNVDIKEQGELKLSNILDSMRFLQVIQTWKKQGVLEREHVQIDLIPEDVQHEIQRLKAVDAKIR